MGLFGSSRKRPPFDLGGAWDQFDPSNPVPGFPPESYTPTQQAPQEKPERWMNGGKFGVRDGIALALSSFGDALAQSSGGQAWATPMLMKGRMDSREARQAGLAAQAKHQQDREDFLWKQEHTKPDEDVFVRQMRMAGIDPASPDGQKLIRQRLATQASPAPNLIGSPETGYHWASAPPPSVPGLTQPPATSPSPTPGMIVGDHRFKGGDPNDPNAWEPVGGGAGNGAGSFRSNIPRGNPLDPNLGRWR